MIPRKNDTAGQKVKVTQKIKGTQKWDTKIMQSYTVVHKKDIFYTTNYAKYTFDKMLKNIVSQNVLNMLE